MALTMQKLLDAMKQIKEIDVSAPGVPFGGMQVICDPNCLETTTERLFPYSRHRSARIRKKLIRRFGGEFRQRPAVFQVMGKIHAHPVRYAELQRQFNANWQGV
ncbi:hypothetical protein [Rhodopseudomonas sp. RCAM05734]|uniref:hypothetical protein n=1 Tax=Rhodopseudomonas sp. RCAM05734 TaxID=3457549 RepID=UPI004044C69E